jgi:hypothetical protein
MIVAQKKISKTTGTVIQTDVIQLSVYERECLGYVKQPFRCPNCSRRYDINNLGPTTHAQCSNEKCPKFCIVCLELETEPDSLWEHNSESVILHSKCPLFLESHSLFSNDAFEAVKDFLHWKIVSQMYEYANSMNASDAIKRIPSLNLYTKDFGLWECIISTLQGKMCLAWR